MMLVTCYHKSMAIMDEVKVLSCSWIAELMGDHS